MMGEHESKALRVCPVCVPAPPGVFLPVQYTATFIEILSVVEILGSKF